MLRILIIIVFLVFGCKHTDNYNVDELKSKKDTECVLKNKQKMAHSSFST